MKLYMYDHCPFSMRPRLIVGLKNIQCEMCIVPVSDLSTVPAMIGKNVRPVLEISQGEYMAESVDIAFYLDKLSKPIIKNKEINTECEQLIRKMLKDYIALTAPFFIETCREFITAADIKRYQHREEQFLGYPLSEIPKHENDIIRRVEAMLPLFEPFLVSDITNAISATEMILFPYLAHLQNSKKIMLPATCKAFVDRCCALSHHKLLQ
ncbi:glutaredoxin 2 [Candidatus Marinamargulisbacteria bacterium SCGC AG-414-C22]|nr:glutaredoxin 2 [Candidatus Marinamargulisbacteria bacterium SCGC AG-414-C22]